MRQDDRLVVVRGKEFQKLLSLADPLTKYEALEYSTEISDGKLNEEIEKHLWWRIRK